MHIRRDAIMMVTTLLAASFLPVCFGRESVRGFAGVGMGIVPASNLSFSPSQDLGNVQSLDSSYKELKTDPFADGGQVTGVQAESSVREIACWGDSLTEGVGTSEGVLYWGEEEIDISYLSYPDILSRLTGMPTYNFGLSGATSEEIAYMQGSLGDIEDTSRFTTINEEIIAQGREHPGDILVLEMGSNGGWNGDYAELIRQYQGMIDHAGVEDYIIIGDTDDPGTSLADLGQEPLFDSTLTSETAWEAALHEAFGAHFINMRIFLIQRGLAVVGLTETDYDLEAAERGCISEQLRSDWTHLNAYGYCAQAIAVYERGKELGYWS